jgi:hypothetical protein
MSGPLKLDFSGVSSYHRVKTRRYQVYVTVVI